MKKRKNLKKIMMIIGVVGAFCSIIALVFPDLLKKNENIKLEVIVHSVDNLTPRSSIKAPGLEVNKKFNEVKVENLWRANATFKNTSSKTIIGEKGHGQKNIINDHILIPLKEKNKLHGIELIRKDKILRKVWDY